MDARPPADNAEVVRQGFEAMRRRDVEAHEETVETDGDMVLATGRTHLRGRGSGVDVEIEWGHVFRLRDGKVLWSKIYVDRDKAREAFRDGAGA